MDCTHLTTRDTTGWHEDVFDHQTYEFACALTGRRIPLPAAFCKADRCPRFEEKKDRPVYQNGDIYLNPCFGDLWVVDGASFVKINDGLRIDLDEPEDFIKVGHTTTRVRAQEKVMDDRP